MPHRSDPPSDDGIRDPAEENNQQDGNPEEPHPDAFGAVAQPPGDQGGVRGGVRAPATPPTDRDFARLTTRDIAVIGHLVLLRVLTYDQLHRLAFVPSDPSIARRRIRHLARTGWVSTWEAPSLRGGHRRYVHPSSNAIRAILPTLTGDAPWAPLIRRMVPRSHRRPLMLGENAPKWLPHQREVNHLVTSIVTSPERRILWASSWDCPFPSRISMFTMPQPDYVLIEEVDGAPRLVFGEHDRGSEPIDRFTARKIALYSALAEFPEVCEQQFGIATFRVDVTVIDPVRRAPIARLRSLLAAATASTRPDIFRFTLGGWLYAYPDAPIWFDVSRAPTNALSCAVGSPQSLLQQRLTTRAIDRGEKSKASVREFASGSLKAPSHIRGSTRGRVNARPLMSGNEELLACRGEDVGAESGHVQNGILQGLAVDDLVLGRAASEVPAHRRGMAPSTSEATSMSDRPAIKLANTTELSAATEPIAIGCSPLRYQ